MPLPKETLLSILQRSSYEAHCKQSAHDIQAASHASTDFQALRHVSVDLTELGGSAPAAMPDWISYSLAPLSHHSARGRR